MTFSSPIPPDEGLPDAVGRLNFGRFQIAILGCLIAMVVVVGALGYRSYLTLEHRTEDLNVQLQLVSNNITSYERQVLIYALTVDRWADGVVQHDELSLARSLLERQRRVTAGETAAAPELREVAENLNNSLLLLDEMTARPPPPPGSPARLDIDEVVDDMALSAKMLFDRTESVNAELVNDLLDSLQASRRFEWIAGLMIGFLVVALVLSLRGMIRTNYGLARHALVREQEQNMAISLAKSEAENQYLDVLEEVHDVVFRIAGDGKWVLLNRAWEVLTGVAADEAVGTMSTEIWHPFDRERIAVRIYDLLKSDESTMSEEARLVRADGVERIVVVGAKGVRDAQTGQMYVAGTINDVTDRVRAQQLSTAQRQILEMVATGFPLQRILGEIVELITPHAPPGTRLRIRAGDDDPDPDSTGRRVLVDGATGDQIGAVEWITPRSSKSDQAGLTATDPALLSLVGLVAQLSQTAIERQLAVVRMAHFATHDSLTNLPNRTLLVDRISVAIGRAAKSTAGFAVLFLDVDRFKLVNDSLGHPAGDQLLVEIAQRLTSSLRSVDTVARFGGDEFVILLEDVGHPDEATEVAERILAEADDTILVGKHQVRVTMSVGIVFGDGGSKVDDLLKHADIAMYAAKHEGRCRYRIFDQSLRYSTSQRHDRSLALQGAIERDEMELWYQPIVELRSGQVRGFEALARWRRPQHGIIPPDQFIELIEDLGMIGDLGHWVLKTALRQVAKWHLIDSELRIGINVSGRELAERDYADRVAAALDVLGVDPSRLVLEITEMVLIEDTEPVRQCLTRLTDLGVHLAIDDFGTGYSSLQYLRQLEVDRLKIDKAFVSSDHSELHDPTIVASVAELSRSLGLEVVAEGVETIEQAEALVALGVEIGQGFLFGRPLPANQIRIEPKAAQTAAV